MPNPRKTGEKEDPHAIDGDLLRRAAGVRRDDVAHELRREHPRDGRHENTRTPEMFKTTDASFQAASSSPSPRKPENTGMNAEPNAPAMTTKKRRSGMRNAET